MAHFELLDDGSRTCVVGVMSIGLSQEDAERRFDRHVADVRSRHEDRIAPLVRAQWVPSGAARDSYDLIAASCSWCGHFVLSFPPIKSADFARVIGSFDPFVLRLLSGHAFFRRQSWQVQCGSCCERARRLAWLRKA